MGITTDRNHPGLKRGEDNEPVPMQETYLVLSDEERHKGYLQPLRTQYKHKTCNGVTKMGAAIAETYARDPWFYGGTYCVHCAMHRDLKEFTWLDGSPMSPHEWDDRTLAEVMKRRKELEEDERSNQAGGSSPDSSA